MTLISDEYSLDELLLLIDMCRILNSQQTVTEHAQDLRFAQLLEGF